MRRPHRGVGESKGPFRRCHAMRIDATHGMHPDARRIVFETLAASIEPPESLPFREWLPKNIVLFDGPLAGEPWSAETAPYLPEIADCLSIEHPCNRVTVRKSQQSAATILALAWALYIADVVRASTLYGVPGDLALHKINSQKITPLIEKWHEKIKRTVILPQTAKSGAGSTTYEKKYLGGFLTLANANAVMDLSSITPRFGIKDEVSKWHTLQNDADPESLFFGRFTAFRRLKTFKIFEISTPEIDTGDESGEGEGHCRIDKAFRKSDQRFWHCECPECHAYFVHKFARFKIDAKRPHLSVYVCDHCGHHVSEAERVVALRKGHWHPRFIGDDAIGRHPGFHIDAFISLMMSYEAIAEDHASSEKSETARKDFANLTLGLPHKFRGDAPDHVRLFERREPLKRFHVPPRGLMLVAFADVQMRGIWYEVMAISPNRETWTIDANYIDGDTADPNGEVFAKLLKATVDREFPDAFGRMRKVDALGIDSGYRSHYVYSVVRNHQRMHPDTGLDVLLATKGLEGWSRPALGTPSLVDIDLEGRKYKQGAKLWGVGTWPLKAGVFTDLHKEGIRSGKPLDPDGYCHFGDWLDENYFKQLTAERFEDVKVRGVVTTRRPIKLGENHYLDCRVGNMALAEYLGLSSTTPAQWAALARHRGLPDDLTRVDLFTHRPLVAETIEAAADQSPPADAPPATTSPASRGGWIGRNTSGWLKR